MERVHCMPLKEKKERKGYVCDYLIWGSTTLSHWALPGGSSLGNTKIIENTKMVKEMRQSTRTHTYTHARLMKSKKKIIKVQKKTSDPNRRSPEKGREGKRKKEQKRLHQRGFPFFFSFFQRVHTLPTTTAAEGEKINKAKLCIFRLLLGGHLTLGLSQARQCKRKK